MKNVYIVNGSAEYRKLFESLGFMLISGLSDESAGALADLVVFTGGSDVSPVFYDANRHPTTYSDMGRDLQEEAIMTEALALDIPMVGICRGAQFLNVMSGGEMYQDVDKHCYPHSITDLQTGEVVYVSSTHHQMMKPSEKGLLVASSTLGGAREWYEGQVFHKDVSEEDIEVVYYEHTKCLCFQPHPEFNGAQYESMKVYFRSLLSRFLGV